jgi:ABC-2 type transport system ATP-binding protein
VDTSKQTSTEVENAAQPVAAAGTSLAIETFGLTRRFGDLTALDQLDLHIPYGSIFGLLGPNGAGKSTTIKMLATLLEPTSGTATIAGFDILKTPAEVRRRIGYVPQLVSADGGLTATENLDFSGRLYGIHGADRKKRIAEALQFVNLTDAANKLVKTYSGGMIRRLEIAQATLHRPAVLILDEPTVGLDPVARRVVWERLLELRQSFGMTILISTHGMDEADELCDELAILHLGKIATIGNPAKLKETVGPEATLDDVFARYSGGSIQEGGSYRDVRQARRSASRLG